MTLHRIPGLGELRVAPHDLVALNGQPVVFARIPRLVLVFVAEQMDEVGEGVRVEVRLPGGLVLRTVGLGHDGEGLLPRALYVFEHDASVEVGRGRRPQETEEPRVVVILLGLGRFAGTDRGSVFSYCTRSRHAQDR